MEERIQQGLLPRLAARKHPRKQTPETMGGRLLAIIVYAKCCRVGGTLTLDDLAETEIGDWTMPNFRAACAYAAAQGWVVVSDDMVTLTTAGLRAA